MQLAFLILGVANRRWRERFFFVDSACLRALACLHGRGGLWDRWSLWDVGEGEGERERESVCVGRGDGRIWTCQLVNKVSCCRTTR